MTAVPTHPEQLLGEEFVGWEAIGAEYGYASTVARLVRADGSTCIAKLGSAQDGRRELFFYRELAPSTPIRVPGFVGGAVEGERSLVLLEEVTGARQGDAEDRRVGDALPVLLEMARLHRTWWERAPAELPWWGRSCEAMAARVRERRPAFVERWGEHLEDHGVLDGLEERLDAARWQAPTTVVHGDLHRDNVLFAAEGPVVMDWQTVGRGPGAVDVCRWLLEALTVEDRKAREDELLAGYVDELGHGTVDALREAVRALTWRMFAGMVGGFAGLDPATCTDRQRRVVAGDLKRVGAVLG